jgi:hypothetical protein
MTDLEIYLIGFALIGYCFAGHYYIQSRQHELAGLMLTRSIIGVALGKVKLELTNGGIKLTDLEDIDNGTTSEQTRQSKGTDRT